MNPARNAVTDNCTASGVAARPAPIAGSAGKY